MGDDVNDDVCHVIQRLSNELFEFYNEINQLVGLLLLERGFVRPKSDDLSFYICCTRSPSPV